MRGLESGRVRLDASHAEWRHQFQLFAAELEPECRSLAAIEHVGSTAVEGLLAKPIIDVALGFFRVEDLPRVITVLTSHGFRNRGYREDAGGLIFDYVVDGLTTLHVHVVQFGSRQWQRYLIFRDYLGGCEEARLDYARLKMRLSAQFPNDRRNYTRSKIEFIEGMTDLAEGLQKPD